MWTDKGIFKVIMPLLPVLRRKLWVIWPNRAQPDWVIKPWHCGRPGRTLSVFAKWIWSGRRVLDMFLTFSYSPGTRIPFPPHDLPSGIGFWVKNRYHFAGVPVGFFKQHLIFSKKHVRYSNGCPANRRYLQKFQLNTKISCFTDNKKIFPKCFAFERNFVCFGL